MEEKIKHLEMIQSIISRMANNSFLIRGWSITLVAALFALSAKDSDLIFICLAYFPAIAFWVLDGYYLKQERLFRNLYNKVRLLQDIEIDFSMDTSNLNISPLVEILFSKTIFVFHGINITSIAILMLVFLILNNGLGV